MARKKKLASENVTTAVIRDWAQKQDGLKVGARGFLSQAVIDAYNAAH